MTKKVIQVAKVSPARKPAGWERTLATLCYFYPQYTFAAARKLPHKRVVLLLQEAARQEAARNYSLLQIVSAPHTEKGKAVEELSEHYRKLVNE